MASCERLDAAVAVVDGHGFRVTPFARADALRRLGFTARRRRLGQGRDRQRLRLAQGPPPLGHRARAPRRGGASDPALAGRPLAIATCGNAALAAAVVARAAGRQLDVFVPPDADPVVVDRLRGLGATVVVCARARRARRSDRTAAPCGVDAGAVPFTCQGNRERPRDRGRRDARLGAGSPRSGRTGGPLDRIVVQVGGGALPSACSPGLAEARRLGAIDSLPRLDAVQTTGAWPLRAAFERVAADLRSSLSGDGPLDLEAHDVRAVLEHAARHRAAYMWPWETEPRSVAHGILDDETYDWLAVVGRCSRPAAPSSSTRPSCERRTISRPTTGIDVDHTGTAGLAGLLASSTRGRVDRDETVAVLFTGVRRRRRAATPPTPSTRSGGAR